jgi:S-(hydroxymethyl)glutathione dehydrogenase/alcohol dehydrogenase
VNTARVEPGASVAVIGCGGVGLSVVMGARLVGAGRIVAIDRVPSRLAAASELGATDAVDASQTDAVEAVRELTLGAGADHAFEVVGHSSTIKQAFEMTRAGGVTTLVGAGRADDPVTFSAAELFGSAKEIRGCIYGSADPDRDFPRFLDLYRAGRLELDRLVTKRIPLADVEDAFRAMEAGEGVRTVITF